MSLLLTEAVYRDTKGGRLPTRACRCRVSISDRQDPFDWLTAADFAVPHSGSGLPSVAFAQLG